MPKSKEWFAQHPRISAYVSQELKDRLIEYMSANGFRSVSDALTVILEQHLGLTTSEKTEDVNTVPDEPIITNLLHSLQSQVLEMQQAIHDLQESSSFISSLNERVSRLESQHSPSSSLINSLMQRLNILEAQVRNISLSSSNLTALEESTALLQSSSLNLIPTINLVEEEELNVNSELSPNLPVKVEVDLAAPEPEPAAHFIEHENTCSSSKNAAQDGNNDLTALEVAQLLGVGERAVNIAAVKGHEHFRNWSAKKGKGIFDFETLHSNPPKPRRRFYLDSEAKPTGLSN